MSHDNDSTNMTVRAPLSLLEKGLGQAAWVVAVVAALFLIAGFIATWLFEHSKDRALADRAFIPLQAIFICFTAMLVGGWAYHAETPSGTGGQTGRLCF